MAENGQRLPAYDSRGPGQLCLTNSDVRKIFINNLRRHIRDDRKEADQKGTRYPEIYSINQNMRANHCYCENCRAIFDRDKSSFREKVKVDH